MKIRTRRENSLLIALDHIGQALKRIEQNGDGSIGLLGQLRALRELAETAVVSAEEQ